MSNPLLIRGRWICTGSGPDDQTLLDGAVAIEGNEIVELGCWAALRAKYPGATVHGSQDAAVIPGLINAHHHSHGVSTIAHGVPDDLLEPWILSLARMRPSDVYLNTLLSCARLLRSGVTTVVDVHSDASSAAAYEEGMRRALRAYKESGMRVAFASGVRTQSFIVHGKGEDQRFLDSLPRELAERTAEAIPGPDRLSEDEYLDIVQRCWRDYADDDRIDVWFAPPGPQWVSDDFMQRIAERAQSLDTGVQTHCEESIYERLQGPKFYGRSTVAHLNELGVLSPRFSLAHGVWLSEADIALLAQTGAALSHNPSSNLRLRAGIAPLNALLGADVTVALGMDGTTLHEDDDMFHEARLAMRLHRPPRLESPAPSPADVFALATSGGAKLLRKERTLGRLAPGYQADMAILDLNRMTWPWVAPEIDPREFLLMRARADDVQAVFVAGELVFAEGKPARFDVMAAAQALSQALAATPFPHEQAQWVAALKPHLEAWYADWKVPELEPYIRYNSSR